MAYQDETWSKKSSVEGKMPHDVPLFQDKMHGACTKIRPKKSKQNPYILLLTTTESSVVAKWTQFRQDSRRAKRGEG
jgi:hypothetical protein